MDHVKDKFHQLIAHLGVVTGTELALDYSYFAYIDF